MLKPGSKVGVVGGGQLGKMFAQVAKRLGYHVSVYSDAPGSPATSISDSQTIGSYSDTDALCKFALSVDALTFEFENIDVSSLADVSDQVLIRPSPEVIRIAQNRLLEKDFLSKHNFPVVDYHVVESQNDIDLLYQHWNKKSVMKTVGFGYDGKGQRVVENLNQAKSAYDELGQGTIIFESFFPYHKECSVIAARNEDGQCHDFGVIDNDHVEHILSWSESPSNLPDSIQQKATLIAHNILDALNVVGVMCVEFFVGEHDQIVVNELAPRPHNSGHLTIEAFSVNQFEMQLRTLCSLPLAAPRNRTNGGMLNIMGDLWTKKEPNWKPLLSMDDTALHLYGKSDPKPKRKMGHVTTTALNRQDLQQRKTLLLDWLGNQ